MERKGEDWGAVFARQSRLVALSANERDVRLGEIAADSAAAGNSVIAMSDDILDVDLLAFERGSAASRKAVVEGVRRSLETGFVYTSHDLSEDLLDTAYGMLAEFFSKSTEEKQKFVAHGTNGQTGYTGVLLETAASSDKPDWKEML